MSLPSSHILQTQSELQLCENIAAAEWHDNCMFNRLVNGIREKQARRLQRRNSRPNYPAANATFNPVKNADLRIEQSLENIVRHRYEDLKDVPPFDASVPQHSPSNCSGNSNVIEPDEEETFEVFQMDDI